MIHANCIFSVCRCIASAFSQLPVLAIQGFRLEKVCRCAEHGVRSLFMFATHSFLSKKVCRCTASVPLPLSVLAIQGFRLEKVCRSQHQYFSLFLCSRYRVFDSKRCVAAWSMDFGRYSCSRHMVWRPKWCVGEGVSVKVCR